VIGKYYRQEQADVVSIPRYHGGAISKEFDLGLSIEALLEFLETGRPKHVFPEEVYSGIPVCAKPENVIRNAPGVGM